MTRARRRPNPRAIAFAEALLQQHRREQRRARRKAARARRASKDAPR